MVVNMQTVELISNRLLQRDIYTGLKESKCTKIVLVNLRTPKNWEAIP